MKLDGWMLCLENSDAVIHGTRESSSFIMIQLLTIKHKDTVVDVET